MKCRRVALSFFFMALLAVMSCSARSWTPPAEILGTWSGKSEVFAKFKKGESPSDHPDDWIEITVTIHRDGRVEGAVGDAKLENCKVASNRGWLGRKLNIKTDYIVRGGYLEGAIVLDDSTSRREFTIPFNIVDGTFAGGLMALKEKHYPWPLFPRLELVRGDAGAQAD